jgi:hypothetical protein
MNSTLPPSTALCPPSTSTAERFIPAGHQNVRANQDRDALSALTPSLMRALQFLRFNLLDSLDVFGRVTLQVQENPTCD